MLQWFGLAFRFVKCSISSTVVCRILDPLNVICFCRPNSTSDQWPFFPLCSGSISVKGNERPWHFHVSLDVQKNKLECKTVIIVYSYYHPHNRRHLRSGLQSHCHHRSHCPCN